jgi:hypothetical protein
MLVRMILRLRLVRAPTVRPDLCGPQQVATGVQDDADGLVVEN